MKKKIVLIAIYVLTLALLVASGSTIAWLVAESGSVTNTFTPSNINITLGESDALNLKMIPGNTITKDPRVEVKANSEACWLFVKIEKSANFDSFMTYGIADGWTELTTGSGIYYREVTSSNIDQSFDIIKDDKVYVLNTVTKAMMNELYSDSTKNPTLTFNAYAVQSANVADAATAWSIATTS